MGKEKYVAYVGTYTHGTSIGIHLYDLDVENDLEVIGENSLNFHCDARAVVLRCENRGTVTGKKENAGGKARRAEEIR